jgi:hypothetical protein
MSRELRRTSRQRSASLCAEQAQGREEGTAPRAAGGVNEKPENPTFEPQPFRVIDTLTGQETDMEEIALKEDWAKHLILRHRMLS